MNTTDSANPVQPEPQAPTNEMNWGERHPGWTLLLVIIGSPFALFGIVIALGWVAAGVPHDLGHAIAIGAISAAPIGYIAILIWIVRWYRARKRQSKAVSYYDKAIQLNPSNADAYYNRGDAYDEMGEYGKAIADYSKAIELAPNHAPAYYNRGCAYGEIGAYDKAIADYTKAIGLNPNDSLTYYNRGLAYSKRGELPRALSDLEKCIELSTDPELTKDAREALNEMRDSP